MDSLLTFIVGVCLVYALCHVLATMIGGIFSGLGTLATWIEQLRGQHLAILYGTTCLLALLLAAWYGSFRLAP